MQSHYSVYKDSTYAKEIIEHSLYKDMFSFTDVKNTIYSTLDTFDFDKVHNVMEFLNWEWYETNGVPSPEEIKAKAEELLWNATMGMLIHNLEGIDLPLPYPVSTCGLTAEAFFEEDKEHNTSSSDRNCIFSIALKFVVENSETFSDEFEN